MIQRTVLAFALLAAATAFAAAAETREQREACTSDANTYCADDIPDREKVYACLVKQVNQLSPACKKIINDSITALTPSGRKR
jgi:hypothetical protein